MELVTFLHITIESGFAMFCIFAAIYIHLFDYGKHSVVKVIMAGLLIDATVNIMDALAYFYRGNLTHTGFLMVRISNFAVFAGMFVLLAVGNMLLDTELEEKGCRGNKHLCRMANRLSMAGVALILILRRFGLLYTFDENNVYHRGHAYLIIPALAVAIIIMLLTRLIREHAALSQKEFTVFLLFYLLPVAGAIIQTLYYGISLANVANSIAILIMVVFLFRSINSEISVNRSFILNGESIERISSDVDGFLKEIGTEWQSRIRIRFTVEETLLNLWQHFGDLNMVKVVSGIKFGIPSIRIEHVGESFNPFSKTTSFYEEWSSGLLSSAGLSPSYSYSHGTNIMKVTLGRMRINPVVTAVISILFGLITGTVALVALSESDADFLMHELLNPAYNLWNNILYSVAPPAMLVIVMSTMLDTREVTEQGGNSGIITGRYFAISLVIGAVTMVSALLISGEKLKTNELSRYAVSGFIKKLFGIIPENLFNPFRDFNSAQIILIGIIFAYAVMAVGHKASGIASIIHQLNMISTQVAQWIANFMPVFTVILTAQLILGHNANLLVSALGLIPYALAITLAVMAYALFYVSSRAKVSAKLLLKKLWPSFLLTLRTGQVADSYALAQNTCIRDLGIQKIFTLRLLPLGLVLYMPASVVGMASFIISAAFRSGIEITPAWILTAIVFTLILQVAAPPIPGINLLSYVVLIGQFGIGEEYVLVAMIFDIIFNVFASAANQMMLQMDMVLQAERVGLLDHRTLSTLEEK